MSENELYFLRESGRLGLEATPDDWPPSWHAWIGMELDQRGRIGVWVFVADSTPGSHESFLTPWFDTVEGAALLVVAYINSVTGVVAAFQPPIHVLNQLENIRSAYGTASAFAGWDRL